MFWNIDMQFIDEKKILTWKDSIVTSIIIVPRMCMLCSTLLDKKNYDN